MNRSHLAFDSKQNIAVRAAGKHAWADISFCRLVMTKAFIILVAQSDLEFISLDVRSVIWFSRNGAAHVQIGSSISNDETFNRNLLLAGGSGHRKPMKRTYRKMMCSTSVDQQLPQRFTWCSCNCLELNYSHMYKMQRRIIRATCSTVLIQVPLCKSCLQERSGRPVWGCPMRHWLDVPSTFCSTQNALWMGLAIKLVGLLEVDRTLYTLCETAHHTTMQTKIIPDKRTLGKHFLNSALAFHKWGKHDLSSLILPDSIPPGTLVPWATKTALTRANNVVSCVLQRKILSLMESIILPKGILLPSFTFKISAKRAGIVLRSLEKFSFGD